MIRTSLLRTPAKGWTDVLLTAFGWACVAAFVAVTVGSSLLGRTTFLGVDLMEIFAPWRTDATIVTDVQVPFLGDTVDGFAPQAAMIVDEAREGSLAEWNPYGQGGVELGGLPNSGVYSPISLPWWVLPHAYAPGAVKLLEILVAAIGMSLLLRRLGLSRPTWPLATLAYVSSGFMVTWTNWPQTRVAAFLPLLFWALDRAAVRPRWREVLILGIPVSSLLLGGFPAVTAYALYAGALYVVVRSAVAHRSVLATLRAGVCSLGGVVFGALLSAWLLLPFAWNAATVLDFDVRRRLLRAISPSSTSRPQCSRTRSGGPTGRVCGALPILSRPCPTSVRLSSCSSWPRS
ncbi:hypothetical protein [Cellulosimicrobium sp. CUA-896]|uniref:hypothetical protein n=1 Tax=Cellulosimicrobium sp. CUA-896 TaxID=1517881 RepID=UPI00095A7248|nr:hypothetical protein [Cellulosimicrobium sp. CUA-896]OLT55449.1 hypothetical protein BJF88_06355 [Cellulosimicrobium sp. CUA-896]